MKKSEKKVNNETVVEETTQNTSGAESVISKLNSVIRWQKVIALFGGVVALVVVIVAFALLIGKGSDEKRINETVNNLAKVFYEEFYYKASGSGDEDKRVENLTKYQDTGIKISIDNLVRYYVTTDEYKGLEASLAEGSVTEKTNDYIVKNFKTKKFECNKDETKAIIRPKSPYGQKDYTIEVITSCGFENEKDAE